MRITRHRTRLENCFFIMQEKWGGDRIAIMLSVPLHIHSITCRCFPGMLFKKLPESTGTIETYLEANICCIAIIEE